MLGTVMLVASIPLLAVGGLAISHFWAVPRSCGCCMLLAGGDHVRGEVPCSDVEWQSLAERSSPAVEDEAPTPLRRCRRGDSRTARRLVRGAGLGQRRDDPSDPGVVRRCPSVTGARDVSRLYVLEDGRRLLLPMLRRVPVPALTPNESHPTRYGSGGLLASGRLGGSVTHMLTDLLATRAVSTQRLTATPLP
jgi:hypothetical protein